jgi:hypothetical protein
MIDPSTEELIPLRESGALFRPRRFRSKDDPSGARTRIGYSTLLRLCTNGDKHANILTSVVILGCRYTTREAVLRYLTEAARRDASAGSPSETVAQHARRVARAKELAKKALHPGSKERRKPASAK